MSEYFSKQKSLRGNMNVELDFSNYATKADLKHPTGVDTSDFAKKTDLVNLKSDADKLDIRKLETALVGLRKLINVVENDVVENTEYHELV